MTNETQDMIDARRWRALKQRHGVKLLRVATGSVAYSSERAPALLLPGIIWRYNEASGTANTDRDGYHETITRFYIAAIGAYLAAIPADLSLSETVAKFMASALGARDLPLKFWSKDRLMSVEARRVWVAPVLAPLDFKPLMA